jgi:hypothetical protein
MASKTPRKAGSSRDPPAAPSATRGAAGFGARASARATSQPPPSTSKPRS